MVSIAQVPMLILALTLLNTIQVSIESTIIRAQASTLENDAFIEANSIGGIMMDEILAKNFDSKTVSANVSSRSQLTTVDSLGLDAGETAFVNDSVVYDQVTFHTQQQYNDVDDYNLYTRTVATPKLGNFTVRDSVYYVQEANTDLKSNVPTWCKKVVVTVTQLNMTLPYIIKSVVVYTKS